MKSKATFLQYVFIILLLPFCQIDAVHAQSNGSKKNSVYVSYGNIILSDQISFSYERLIFEKNRRRTKAKLTFGKYLSNNGDYATNASVYQNYISLSAVQLIGLLEINAGLAHAQYKLASGFDPEPNTNYSEIQEGLVFYGNIGLRYEKNNFLLRAGIGNLELLYVGIGFQF